MNGQYSELPFYSIYFNKIANKLNIPSSYFYKPSPSKLNNPVHKTYSQEYFKLISKSKMFIDDFINYIKNVFEEDYNKKIPFLTKNMVILFLKKYRENY